MERFSKITNTRRRRTTALRLIILTVVLWFLYNAIFAWVESVQSLENARDKWLALMNTTLGVGAEGCSVHRSSTDSSFDEADVSQMKSSIGIDSIKAKDRPQAPLSRAPSHSIEAQTVTDEDAGLQSHSDFIDALRHVLSLLPDELHIRDLLRPLEGTGEEYIREIGLRSRSYKTFFAAWEALHLVSGAEGMYVRDDVVQYLHRHPELADDSQMGLAEMIRSYEAYRSFMAHLSNLLFPWTAPYFSNHMLLHSQLYNGGRGIVLFAGDHHAPFLLTSIPSLRQLGCDLPIEILYLGDDDLSEGFRIELESIPGVIARDLSQMVNDKGWTLAGWAGKPFAILFSSFREVIFIDADSLFFQNPEILFQDPAYLDTGALFFKDRLMMPELKKKWLQRILPKPISRQVTKSRLWTGESGHMQESGVVVVDKWKHFVALLLVTRMNGPDRDGNAAKGKVGVYDMVYGDKETFWLGWELMGDLDYAFHDGDAGIMGSLEKETPSEKKSGTDATSNKTKNGGSKIDETEEPLSIDESLESEKQPTNFTICAPQLLHLDLEGRPLWFNGWLLPNKFAEQKHLEPAKFEAYLREPRERQEPGAWQLRESNICCLTTEYVFEFSQKEKDILEMIIDSGRRAGAFGKIER